MSARTCRVVDPEKKDTCCAPAIYVVVFGDGDMVNACLKCALFLRQTAEICGTIVGIEKPK